MHKKVKTLVIFLLTFNFSILSNKLLPSHESFEENCGQLGDIEGNKVKEVIFYTKYKDFGVYITEKGVSYVIYRYEEPPQAAGNNEYLLPHEREPIPMKIHYSRIDIDLVNSSIERSNIEYKEELPGYSNYYLGHCPEGVLYVKSYREVRIKNVYKGIDWIWRYDDRGELHHEFELSEESEPEAIKLKINYSDYELTPNGKKLILSTPLGKIEDGFVIGHRSESMIFPVEVSYVENPDKTIGYNVSNWDRGSKLIIDPPLSLTWGTFYGGSGIEIGRNIISSTGNSVFVSGFTTSTDFPVFNPGGGAYFQGNLAGYNDLVLMKFSGSGVRLWATYYGGSVDDMPYSSCQDSSGNIFLVGSTTSSSFPVFNPGGGAYYQSSLSGLEDGFVLKFNNSGVRLWSTYYGGSQTDRCFSVACSDSGKVNIGGYTNSTDFPVLNPGGGSYFQSSFAGGNYDLFLVKFENYGKRLWSTYYGGNGSDYFASSCIWSERSGNILYTGYTNSTNFPVLNSSGAYFQPVSAGDYDLFIMRFDKSCVRLWSTYYGGGSYDNAYGLSYNNAEFYVTGLTSSSNFPVFNPGGGAYFQPVSNGGLYDGIILKFDTSGSRLWATYYGGSSNDYFIDVETNINGSLYLTGYTLSYDFPVFDPGGGTFFMGTYQGSVDAVLVSFSNSGVRQWSTYYGGSSGDYGNSVASDNSGNVYLTGYTNSANLPVQNPGGGAYFQGTLQGTRDFFICKFGNNPTYVTKDKGDGNPEFKVLQNYPNPFNPETFIEFSMPEDGFVIFRIHDITGKEISVLINEHRKSGNYVISFNGSDLSSGIYFYSLLFKSIDGRVYNASGKMVLKK